MGQRRVVVLGTTDLTLIQDGLFGGSMLIRVLGTTDLTLIQDHQAAYDLRVVSTRNY